MGVAQGIPLSTSARLFQTTVASVAWHRGQPGESLHEMLPELLKWGVEGILSGEARRKREGGRALSYLSAFAT